MSALAHAAPSVHVLGEETACPSPAQLTLALNQAFSEHQADTSAAEDGIAVRVSDEGPSYKIAVGADAREFVDETRSCEDRARAATVFIVLLIEPPVFTSPAPPPAAKPPPPKPPAPPPDRRLSLEIEAAGFIDGAPNAKSSLSGGGAVRVNFGLPQVGLTLGVIGSSPVDFNLSDIKVELTRVPLDLGVRGALRLHRLELEADAGVAMMVDLLAGKELATQNSSTRLEWGLRLALSAKIWFGRIAPFISFQSLIFPSPIAITVETSAQDYQTIGKTPIVWLGGLIGMAIKIF